MSSCGVVTVETSRMEEDEEAVKGEEGELGGRELSPETRRSRRPCTRMRGSGSGLLGQDAGSSGVITLPGPVQRRQNKRSKVKNKRTKRDHVYSKVFSTPDRSSQSREPSPPPCSPQPCCSYWTVSEKKKKQPPPHTVDRKVGKDPSVPRRSEVKQKEEGEGEGSSSTDQRKRRANCRSCAACLREDCGKCVFCLDKKKFGGRDSKKQRCQFRRCLLVGTSGNLKQSRSRPRPLDPVQTEEVSTTTMETTATKPQRRRRRRRGGEKTEELLQLQEEDEWSEGVMERGTCYEIEVELPVTDSDE